MPLLGSMNGFPDHCFPNHGRMHRTAENGAVHNRYLDDVGSHVIVSLRTPGVTPQEDCL